MSKLKRTTEDRLNNECRKLLTQLYFFTLIAISKLQVPADERTNELQAKMRQQIEKILELTKKLVLENVQ